MAILVADGEDLEGGEMLLRSLENMSLFLFLFLFVFSDSCRFFLILADFF